MDESLVRRDDHWAGTFRAMAGPCEVLIETDDRREAQRILAVVASEAGRVERKYSRYLDDSVVSRINRCDGDVSVDDETARLIEFSAKLFALSGGTFDVTSGVLRRVWTFDGSDRVPSAEAVDGVRTLVGWSRVRWRNGRLGLPAGMQIDFGGIAKEYAVDRSAALVARAVPGVSCLINFGGDLAITVPRSGGSWRVGIEPVAQAAGLPVLTLARGGLATSGDARRFLLRDGVRYSHILDPRTGWPVVDAPRSVTVAAGTCTDAGMLATLAMLQGPDAESFLAAQGVRHWIQR
jgi:thiamine biosynthesis lipoprotein